jgi:hypothetical protein
MLDQLQRSPPGKQHRQLWSLVARNLESRRMPPDDADQPTDHERETVVAAIRAGLEQCDCTGPIDPGRVPIRRLTRYEYRRTIRDLLGIDYQPALDFPADDVGHGFDNMGDVLALSPLLFEKYLAAAEEIAQRVVGPLPEMSQRKWRAADLIGGDFGHKEDDFYVLTSQGTLHRRVSLERRGSYRVRVSGQAQQAGPQLARLGLQLNGQLVREFEIQEPSTEPFERVETVVLEPGEAMIGLAFLNDYYQPDAVDERDRDRNLMIHSLEIIGPLPEPGWPTPQWQRILAAGDPDSKAEQASREEKTRSIVHRLATLAYRRPPTSDEVSQLLSLIEQSDSDTSLESDLQHIVTAILVAPQFLFRIEQDGEPGSAAVRELNDYELATRLAYFLWSSMPDDGVLAQAQQGNLHLSAQLRAAARRMLQDAKSYSLVENFADQWLQLRQLDSLKKDPAKFPQFSDELLESMRTETHLFVASIFQQDRSVLDLLDSDYTFVDARLAELYGIDPAPAAGFQRVSLQGTPRRGILTQAAVLNITSLPTRTSPVLRGKWILDNLLLDPPPPPLPGVPPLPDRSESDPHKTLRERLERHRRQPECSACHNRMDPLGFALENFDAVGAWRDHDEGQPLDLAATLPDGTALNGVDELRKILRVKYADEFVRCLAEKLFVYALGRGPEDFDECTLRQIVKHARAHGDRFSAIVEAIVASDAFRKRRAETAEIPP